MRTVPTRGPGRYGERTEDGFAPADDAGQRRDAGREGDRREVPYRLHVAVCEYADCDVEGVEFLQSERNLTNARSADRCGCVRYPSCIADEHGPRRLEPGTSFRRVEYRSIALKAVKKEAVLLQCLEQAFQITRSNARECRNKFSFGPRAIQQRKQRFDDKTGVLALKQDGPCVCPNCYPPARVDADYTRRKSQIRTSRRRQFQPPRY
jgi:hypothetical protein